MISTTHHCGDQLSTGTHFGDGCFRPIPPFRPGAPDRKHPIRVSISEELAEQDDIITSVTVHTKYINNVNNLFVQSYILSNIFTAKSSFNIKPVSFI